MERKITKIPKYQIGDVLFCTLYKVTVVLTDRYDEEDSHLPISWNCHVRGEVLKSYIVKEDELIEVI